MNATLKTRSEADAATKYFEDNGYTPSGLSCKNWECFSVLPHLKDGNILDCGSDGGILLENATKKGIKGFKVGIDLAYPENKILPDGTNLVKGDLMESPFPDKFFSTVVSLSVLEHEIDYEKFAKESSRLLSKGGQLFVSFDYAPKKIDTSLTKLYSLSWNVLCKEDVERLIDVCSRNGLVVSGEIDWSVQDMVINDQWCSPAVGIEYTFFVLEFIKQ